MNSTHPPIIDTRSASATPSDAYPPTLASAQHDRGTASDGRFLDQLAPLIDAPAFFGPPVLFLAGPWMLLVLMLLGPFVALFMVLLVLAVATALVALLAAVIASPYLLIRRRNAERLARPKPRAVRPLFHKLRVGFGQSGTTQPKGLS